MSSSGGGSVALMYPCIDREADWHRDENSDSSSLFRISVDGVDCTTCRRSLPEVLASSIRDANSWGGGRPRALPWLRAK